MWAFVSTSEQSRISSVNLDAMTSTDATSTVTVFPHRLNGRLLRPAASGSGPDFTQVDRA